MKCPETNASGYGCTRPAPHLGDHEFMPGVRAFVKTAGQRKQAAQDARNILHDYRKYVAASDSPDADRRHALELLRAIAKLEHALHLQTGGKLGRLNANATTVARRYGLEV